MSIKSVLVTGANRGIGLEFVKKFASNNKPPIHLFATCRNPDDATELNSLAASHPNIHILKFDVTDYAAYPQVRQQIADRVGDIGLNLLINNAGIAIRGGIESMTREDMMKNFEVNSVAPLLLSQELLPLLKKAAGTIEGASLSCARAAIVNISSKVGSIEDNTSGGFYAYRTSKAALNMITKSLSVDLKPMGILAFCLHPGWVVTDMGGPRASINTETSVNGMLDTIFKANDSAAGVVFNYDGKPIPY